MTITLQENLTAKNFTPAAMVPATWGIGPRTLVNITIHWWGDPVGQNYGGILDWFCNPQSSCTTSAHMVASDGQVACIVSPEDAAWHAGSAYGNVHSIGIECNPRCSPADYLAVAWAVAQLRSWYGPLPLVPHKYWTSTTCPGDYRIDNIDTLAAQISGQATDITPIGDMTVADFNSITKQLNTLLARTADINTSAGAVSLRQMVANGTRAAQAAQDNTGTINTTAGPVSMLQFIAWGTRSAQANQTALTALPGMSAALARLDAKPSPVLTVDTATVTALAAAIRDNLAPDIVAALAKQLSK